MDEREITYSDAIREALTEEMDRDDGVFLIGEDVGVWGNEFGCTKGMLEKYGKDRVMDAPISEAAIAGCALGCAVCGFKPVMEIMYIDFISIAMDQIVNHAAKWHQLSNGKLNVPMVVRTQGGVGLRSSSQHSQCLENWFVHVPGLVVVMPSSSYDVKGLLKAAIRDPNPVIFIEHKMLYRMKEHVPQEEYLISLGKAEIKRKGKDITIVANSWMVHNALSAANRLDREGVSCEVIDPRTLYPLDKNTICASVAKTGYALVVNEANGPGGWSGEVSAVIMEHCFNKLKKPVKRVTGMYTAIPYDKDLEKQVVPGEGEIVDGVRALLK